MSPRTTRAGKPAIKRMKPSCVTQIPKPFEGGIFHVVSKDWHPPPPLTAAGGGVRESLEEQTMAMARNAKALIEENLRYPDGTPVQCVIADSTIGGGAEAAACADKFSTQNVVATLTVTRCWCYGSETFDMDPLTIKAGVGL